MQSKSDEDNHARKRERGEHNDTDQPASSIHGSCFSYEAYA
jgi:hypothetical protein